MSDSPLLLYDLKISQHSIRVDGFGDQRTGFEDWMVRLDPAIELSSRPTSSIGGAEMSAGIAKGPAVVLRSIYRSGFPGSADRRTIGAMSNSFVSLYFGGEALSICGNALGACESKSR